MTDEQGTIFYKPSEVAEILEVSRDAVMRLIKNHELAAVHLPRQIYRVMDHQLAAYQQKRDTEPNR